MLSQTTTYVEREQLRAGLMAHRERERAGRLLDEQRSERAAVSGALTDASEQRDGMTLSERAAGKRPNADLLAARRRDAYRSALSYPMTAEELLLACDQACDDARLPDDVNREDTLSALMAHVIGRYGAAPLRCDIGRSWLRTRAHGIYQRTLYLRERQGCMRAAAAELARWHADDEASERESDPVMWRAQNLPAPDEADELSAADAVRILGLSGKMAAALTRAINAQRLVTLAATDSENMAASRARAQLRKMYAASSDRDMEASIRFTLRPMRALSAAIDGAISQQRERAAIAGSRGSHLPGRSPSMAASMRPILRRADERLSRADRVWTYGLTAREDRAARR